MDFGDYDAVGHGGFFGEEAEASGRIDRPDCVVLHGEDGSRRRVKVEAGLDATFSKGWCGSVVIRKAV